MTTNHPVAEIEAELEEARKAVRPIYTFKVRPVVRSYDKVYDDSCVFYSISGAVETYKSVKPWDYVLLPGMPRIYTTKLLKRLSVLW